MEALIVAVLLVTSVALLVGSRRYDRWAATERASGRTTWWTRSIGPDADLQQSHGKRLRNQVAVGLAVAIVVLSFVVSATTSWVLIGVAALLVVAIYASRFRA